MEEQQIRTHGSILDGIAHLTDRRYHEERHTLIVDGRFGRELPIDRHSLEHLVTVLDNRNTPHEAVTVTELELAGIRLSEPSDGGVNVLRDFFARSDTTLTKISLYHCDFGQAEEASQLLAAFERNRTVVDMAIRRINNLEGAALGNSLSGLLQNMPQLQRLDCSRSILRVDGFHAFQPALQANRTLKKLILAECQLGDEGIRQLADALVGNTTIDVVNIGFNGITFRGLDDITRILESTQLKSISLEHNRGVFDDEASTQRFARVLSRHEFLKELELCICGIGDDVFRLIVHGLVGNTVMEVLDINHNLITSRGLCDITRLLESTRLKMITLFSNLGLFGDEDATQHFISTLQHKKSSIEELIGIHEDEFPEFAIIKNSLTRNRQLNRVKLLLAPPPPSPMQQQQRNAGTMMLKISHKAIIKFAKVPNNAGASAIFKLFTARPQLLEKRLKRPASASDAAVAQEQKRSRRF